MVLFNGFDSSKQTLTLQRDFRCELSNVEPPSAELGDLGGREDACVEPKWRRRLTAACRDKLGKTILGEHEMRHCGLTLELSGGAAVRLE